ncbi:MAG TPA: flagellar motor protein MotB [Kofleriaceae bacterium]|jgi:chemotaxis protein MotB
MAEAPKRRVIKKVDGGHGHHGGAWKVAYADFVTAMMALFMVLWLLASSDSNAKKEIANYFRSGILPEGSMAMNKAAQITPSVIEVAPTPPPPGSETIDDTAVTMQNEMVRLANVDKDLAEVIRNVHIEITNDGILMEIVDQDKGLLFDLSSAKLAVPLTKFLKQVTPLLVNSKSQIEINGHTDATPFAKGNKLDNWDLSYQRAEAARSIIVQSGLDEKRIDGVFARGSSHPFVKDNVFAPQNRRLSILIKTSAKTADAAKVVSPQQLGTTK